MVSGSAWMTAGSLASRILGAIYVIPWLWMIGSSKNGELANGLMSVGYRIYNVFLAIATAGLPAALSKTVAYYNEKKQYRNAWTFFVRGGVLMVALGIFSAILMYVTAPLVATNSPKVNFDDAVMVIRSLTPAVAIIPVMSLIRGFIQGHHQMAPSALSQFYEQVARVFYMLLATYIVMKVLNGEYAVAVAHSTFAAFVGAVVSLVYLVVLIYRQKDQLFERIDLDQSPEDRENMGYYFHMMKEALPFVLFASGTELFGLIDQLSYQQLMTRYTSVSPVTIARMYGVFSFNVQKLVMIVISIAASIGITSLPLISSSFARGDKKRLGHLIEENLSLFMLVMLPASLGVFIAAEPLYNVFYAPNNFGVHYLRLYALISILLGLFMVLGYILQALDLARHMVIGLLIGLALKMVWQPVMVRLLLEYGTALSSFIGILLTVAYYLYVISQQVQLNWKRITLLLLRLSSMCAIMLLGTALLLFTLKLFLPVQRKLYALIILILVAAVGSLIYLVLGLMNGQADKLLAGRADKLRALLHIRRYAVNNTSKESKKQELPGKDSRDLGESKKNEPIEKTGQEDRKIEKTIHNDREIEKASQDDRKIEKTILDDRKKLDDQLDKVGFTKKDAPHFEQDRLTYPDEDVDLLAEAKQRALEKQKAEEESQWGLSFLLDNTENEEVAVDEDAPDESSEKEEVLEEEDRKIPERNERWTLKDIAWGQEKSDATARGEEDETR
ncbi:polysaccharide biosynthesis protein [Atopobacter sp. AH10]|uniref:putative polysaccharide biosynthesis protein n=1 Tax=Atopobacter sp. AH10 TaxID=2315861 RepID=UPI000EF27BEE|nr:polysaccharide biosynthesis protein [Atopobacter sp. AH10]RLK62426.1 polysaccharide biosynthesis protein [Atopobacter sp. AH10]